MTIWQAGMTSTELAAAIIEEAGGDIEFVSEAELAEALAAYAPKASPTFTGDVKIPDGNADGEALAYLQAGARLQNLRFDSAEPYLDFNETDQAVDLRRWRVQAFNGDLYVQPVTDGAIPTTTPIRVNRNGAVSFAGAPAVTVPAPTASGHALRQGSNATVGALTATGDVKISSETPNLYIYDTNSAAGTRNFKINVNGNTSFLRAVSDDGLSVVATLAQMDNITGEVAIGAGGSVTVPVPTASGQAAQISAIDAATGRLAIGGREIGDTGWRNISSLLLNGWTGKLEVRRVGPDVIFRTGYSGSNSLDGSAATDATFLNPAALPPGFRWDTGFSSDRSIPFYQTTGAAIVSGYWFQSDWSAPGFGAAANKYTFFTGEVRNTAPVSGGWPTSLPGTAA
jgi:hypothetical protein